MKPEWFTISAELAFTQQNRQECVQRIDASTSRTAHVQREVRSFLENIDLLMSWIEKETASG